MQLQSLEVGAAASAALEAAPAPVSMPLILRGPLRVFLATVQSGVTRATRHAAESAAACPEAESDQERDRRRRVVLMFLRKISDSSQVDTIETFERILNGCLSLGYRARPLAAFVFGVLEPRFSARIRRRLLAAGVMPSPDDVADVVGAAAETLARLIRDARRSEYTLRYALLLSLADHRAVDFIRSRRRRPESVGLPEGDGGELAAEGLWGVDGPRDPEEQMHQGQRHALAVTVRAAVFAAVNALPHRERAALIAVDLHGAGYPEVARALDLSATDVGNVVRRARLLRDRALVPHLRGLPHMGGHVGFAEIQDDKTLRLQILRWSADIGAGVCGACAQAHSRLHDSAEHCTGDA